MIEVQRSDAMFGRVFSVLDICVLFFFFQAEDGIRDLTVTGVQTCALPISDGQQIADLAVDPRDPNRLFAAVLGHPYGPNPQRGIYRSTDGAVSWERVLRSEERRVGEEGRSRGAPDHLKKKKMM